MGIKVIIDGSPEGQEIKIALEGCELQTILSHIFVIRWGNFSSEEDGRVIFNPSQSIRNTIDKENMVMMLEENHVRCPKRVKPNKNTDFPIIGRKYSCQNDMDIKVIDSIDESKKCDCDYFLQCLNIIEEYHFHVMDLKVFYIEEKYIDDNEDFDEPVIRSRISGWKLREANLSCKDADEVSEIEDMAIKAIHSLGLDFGVVNIARDYDGKYYVLNVDESCKWMSKECSNAYISQFTETLIKYNNLLQSTKDITIGADIECVMKDNNTGELIYASDFFNKDGPIGFDNRSIETGRRYFPLLEIRPQYSTNPIQVVNSIQSIMSSINEHIYYRNIGLYAGSMPLYNYWIGGHIHFGTKPNSKLLKALDNYLALPVMMVENAYSARDRNTKYGQLGNIRLKSHGGFEYRSLSSWIINPEIARAVLSLAKIIVHEYLNLNEEFLCNLYDIKAYYSVNKTCFTCIINKIIDNITHTDTFEAFKSYVEPFFEKVLSFEEWDENKPINDAWNIVPYGDVFKITQRCFMLKKKREELNVEVEKVLEIRIGRQKYKLIVYPRDDFSIEKDSYVRFSSDMCERIGIDESDNLEIWFDPKLKTLRAGPVFGILSDIENNKYGPFGKQSNYFRKLIKFSKCKGMIAYVFTIYDIEWDKVRVKGYTYDFKSDTWITRYFPIPDVIYDRGDVVNEKNYGVYANNLINNIRIMNIKLINSLECINLTNDKWKTYQVLSSFRKLLDYLPKTYLYKDDGLMIECLRVYGHIFLKMRSGSRGKGIFSIKRTGSDNYQIVHKDRYGKDIKYEANGGELIQIISNLINGLGRKKTDFIIQRGVSLATYQDRNFEIRVVMQKNSKGLWFRTCMVARCWGETGEFINIFSESDIGSTEVLKQVQDSKTEQVENKIREVSKDIVYILEASGIQAGEVAVDFAIDKNLNIYVLELNSKPDNLLSSIGAFKMRNLAVNRVLEYARFLVGKLN